LLELVGTDVIEDEADEEPPEADEIPESPSASIFYMHIPNSSQKVIMIL